MIEEARLSGLPGIEREPLYHKEHHLLLKEVRERFPNAHRVITVYIGLEVSIAAWCCEKLIDADNYLTGDSPMGVRSSGWLPNMGTLSLYYEDGRSLKEIEKLISGEGGLKSYYGTEDLENLSRRVEDLPFEAFLYWIAKGIGGMAAILKGKPDIVILGGPWVRYEAVILKLKKRLSYLPLIESDRIR